MKNNSLHRKIISILVITLILSVATTNVAYAESVAPPQSGQQTQIPVIIRQGEPIVHSEPVIQDETSMGTFSIAEIYRAGWTDAYWVWLFPINITHYGSHNSQSDLVEDFIWIDGNLTIQGAVFDSCANHTSGQYAQCETSELFHIFNSITAKSWHYFHKSGYVDQNFTSSKTVTS